MDYLDTKKELRERLILMLGYGLVTIAIVIATLVLVYQAYGFDLGKNGTVIQNGLAFFSSQPNPANIYLNGTLNSSTTNARLILPSGIYRVRLTKSGYRDWQRTIEVNGGNVEHFDYPVLFPNKLVSIKKHTYASPPGFMTESPSRRFLVIEQPSSQTNFDVYDLKNPARPALTTLTLPTSLLSKATASSSLQVVQWADDNQHLLVRHDYDGKTEFILVDIVNPTQSVNLNTSFSTTPTELTLNNTKYNQYYIYNSVADTLQTATLGTPSLTPLLDHVLAYQSYGSGSVLYISNNNSPANKVFVKLEVDTTNYQISTLATSPSYLLNLTTYNGTLYVADGATNSSRVFIYQDPVSQLSSQPNQPPVPIWVLHVPEPNYLSFSDNTQFIVAENGVHYGVYDIENNLGFSYSNNQLPLDAPQTSASWMDGDRLTYVSSGKLIVQDYDNNNQQTLIPASSAYLPAFSSNYRYLYTLSKGANGQLNLEQTPLLLGL